MTENQKFESYFKHFDLSKHTKDSWWGSRNTCPLYKDSWTNGVWIGWEAKSKENKENKCA